MHAILDRLLSQLRNLALLALLAAVPATAPAQAAKAKPPRTAGSLAFAEQGYFFIGGRYATAKNGQQIMAGQMYVQLYPPRFFWPLRDCSCRWISSLNWMDSNTSLSIARLSKS